MEITQEPAWLEEVTDLKQVALDRLAAMPSSERDAVSPSAGWSASGIVEHLVLVEECIAGPWREKLSAVPNAKVGFKSEFTSRAVSFVFAKTNAQVPTVSELEPKGDIEPGELEICWANARARLIESLPQDEHAAWILHPALGPLSSSQMGRILAAHLKYHLRRWPKPTS